MKRIKCWWSHSALPSTRCKPYNSPSWSINRFHRAPAEQMASQAAVLNRCATDEQPTLRRQCRDTFRGCCLRMLKSPCLLCQTSNNKARGETGPKKLPHTDPLEQKDSHGFHFRPGSRSVPRRSSACALHRRPPNRSPRLPPADGPWSVPVDPYGVLV